MINDNNYNYTERKELLGMEFIKLNNGNYMIKNSNGRIVSEKEKLQLENKELVIEDIKSECAKDITKKISKNKKRIKEIDENIEETKPIKE
jgi:hypothetical protein